MLPSCWMKQQSCTRNALLFLSIMPVLHDLGGQLEWGRRSWSCSPALEQSGWSVSTSHAAKEPMAKPCVWTFAPFLYPVVFPWSWWANGICQNYLILEQSYYQGRNQLLLMGHRNKTTRLTWFALFWNLKSMCGGQQRWEAGKEQGVEKETEKPWITQQKLLLELYSSVQLQLFWVAVLLKCATLCLRHPRTCYVGYPGEWSVMINAEDDHYHSWCSRERGPRSIDCSWCCWKHWSGSFKSKFNFYLKKKTKKNMS